MFLKRLIFAHEQFYKVRGVSSAIFKLLKKFTLNWIGTPYINSNKKETPREYVKIIWMKSQEILWKNPERNSGTNLGSNPGEIAGCLEKAITRKSHWKKSCEESQKTSHGNLCKKHQEKKF